MMRRIAPVLAILVVVILGVAVWSRVSHPTLRGPLPTPGTTPGPIFADTPTTYPLTLYDALSRRVTIKARPLRIISLAPAITETLYAIGAGARLIADTDYCTYPEAAKKLPHVGGYLDPNIEKITSLKPDLILANRGTERTIVDKLAKLGTPLVALDPASFEDVCEITVTIGAVVDALPKATALAQQLRTRRANVALTSTFLSDKPMVLFLFSLDGLNSAGPGTFIDDLITLAGGDNVAKSTGKEWPELSMEAVVAADPSVIVVLSGHGGGALTPAKALATLRTQDKWKNIAAVKGGRVFVLDDDLITIPGPRLIDGLEALSKALHTKGQ
jgi:iron complex transport system substrate-binding protein